MKRLLVGATAALLALTFGAVPSSAGLAKHSEHVYLDSGEFPYGVGVNDVRPSSAFFWTQTSAANIQLLYTTDPTFTTGVKTRDIAVDPGHDGTVFYGVRNLSRGATYYYKFVNPATSGESRVGTFQTAPVPTADVGLTFDVSGDQDGTINPATGMPCYNTFQTFTTAAADHPAFYVNLGDTIYSDSACKEAPGGIGDDVTLDQYRADHKQNISYDAYRTLRSATGWYSQWDDHEVRNDFDPSTVDPQLLANGRQAFQEYEGVGPAKPNLGFYRHFSWGANADVFILDERSFRTNEADRMDVNHDGIEDCQNATTGQPDLAPTLNQGWRDYFAAQLPGSGLDNPTPQQCLDDLNAPHRTMLGNAQRRQFLQDLRTSTATWKFVLTEDQMQQFFAFPYDRWEGFRWERDRILSYIDQNQIKNVVWLATDVHASMAHTVDYNTSDPGIGTTVQGMIEYSFGPVATETFAGEINRITGNVNSAGKIRGFLVFVQKDTCAAINTIGYGKITIDPGTHDLSIYPIQFNGIPIAGNGGGGGAYSDCYDYHASPAP